MQFAARPFVAAGVALVGASAIALNPVAPPMPDIQVPALRAEAQLSALANPFEPVIEEAIANLESLAGRIAANPAPILEQILANQQANADTLSAIGQTYVTNLVNYLTGDDPFTSLRGNIQTIIDDFEAGNYATAFSNAATVPILLLTGGDLFGVLGMLPQLVGILQQPFDNLSNAIGAVGDINNILPLGLGLLSGLLGTGQSLGEGLEAFVAGIDAGDPAAAINGLLNGAAGALGAISTGLLASGDTPFENGIVGGLLLLREAVAAAIAPSETVLAASAAPQAAALQVAATADPLATWAQVIGMAVENISALGQTIAANPAPLAQQFIENQLANIELLAPAVAGFAEDLVAALALDNPNGIPALLGAAFEEIASGNLEGGVPDIFSAFLQPVLFPALGLLIPVGEIVTQAGANVANLAEQVLPAVAQIGIGALSPIYSTFAATGAAGQAVVDAVAAGDIAGAIAAVLDAPGVITGGLLNGYGFDAGLLSEFGTIAGILRVREALATAIAPQDAVEQARDTLAVAANQPPSAKGTFVTVTADSGTEDGAPPVDEANAKVAAVDEADDAGTGDAAGAATAEADPAAESEEVVDSAAEAEVTDGKANGATDLTDGNKVEPGKSGSSSTGKDRLTPVEELRNGDRGAAKGFTSKRGTSESPSSSSGSDGSSDTA